MVRKNENKDAEGKRVRRSKPKPKHQEALSTKGGAKRAKTAKTQEAPAQPPSDKPNKLANKTSNKSSNKPSNKSSNKTSNKSANKSSNKTSNKTNKPPQGSQKAQSTQPANAGNDAEDDEDGESELDEDMEGVEAELSPEQNKQLQDIATTLSKKAQKRLAKQMDPVNRSLAIAAQEGKLQQPKGAKKAGKDLELLFGAAEPLNEPEKRGVVYLGHIPYGFFEKQMKGFFAQFGQVTRLKLARSKKNGASRHFAFIEFNFPEVAQIVADTMDRYMMFGRALVCHVVPTGKVHPDTFKSWEHFRKVPWKQLAIRRHNQDRSAEKQAKRTKKLTAKEKAKRAKLAAMGISYSFPGYEGAADESASQRIS